MGDMQSEALSYSPIPETIPSQDSLIHARTRLITSLPDKGHGSANIAKHIETDIVPAFENHNRSPNYYGFVTGGTTPAALHADHIAVDTDQTAQVYLPKETIAVELEDGAMRMLCDLFDLDQRQWSHRTLTTGATASNVLGLAMGRDAVIQTAAARTPGYKHDKFSVADRGIRDCMHDAGLEDLQVVTTVPHSSLRKAASVVGIGRSHVRDVGRKDAPHRFDMDALEQRLKCISQEDCKIASIVVVSCAEVNTGFFATNGEAMQQIRTLCDKYGAWLHVDAAFGLLARCLPNTPEFANVKAGVANMHLADSITSDAHKLLNVPYDSGIFLSRHLSLGVDIFQNTSAAYLTPLPSSATTQDPTAPPNLPSPLNIGIENSRRLRALPLYATLSAYGHAGYQDMLIRQIRLARAIAVYIRDSPHWTLLPTGTNPDEDIFIIVLFRAKEGKLNQDLVRRVNEGRKVYVSGTVWEGEPAARFAVSSWMVDPEREVRTVSEVLEGVVAAASADR